MEENTFSAPREFESFREREIVGSAAQEEQAGFPGEVVRRKLSV